MHHDGQREEKALWIYKTTTFTGFEVGTWRAHKKKKKLLCGQYYYFPIRSELGSKILKLEFPKIKFWLFKKIFLSTTCILTVEWGTQVSVF